MNFQRTYLVLIALTIAAIPNTVRAAGIQSQTTFDSLGEVPRHIFGLLITFLPAVATIFLAISGYRYIVSQGNPDLMEKAKKNLTYAVVGVVVTYSAFLIVRLIGRELGFGLSL